MEKVKIILLNGQLILQVRLAVTGKCLFLSDSEEIKVNTMILNNFRKFFIILYQGYNIPVKAGMWRIQSWREKVFSLF